MKFILALSALALAASAQILPVQAQGCSAAGPAISSVSVSSATPDGNMTRYTLTGTVVNGGGSQPSNMLQSVAIFMAGDKLDSRSIPPLQAGQSYKFSYDYLRSRDAGNGTTRLAFKLDPSTSSCGASAAVRF